MEVGVLCIVWNVDPDNKTEKQQSTQDTHAATHAPLWSEIDLSAQAEASLFYVRSGARYLPKRSLTETKLTVTPLRGNESQNASNQKTYPAIKTKKAQHVEEGVKAVAVPLPGA